MKIYRNKDKIIKSAKNGFTGPRKLVDSHELKGLVKSQHMSLHVLGTLLFSGLKAHLRSSQGPGAMSKVS